MNDCPAMQYAAMVPPGKIVASKWVRLAVERHYRDLKTANKRGLYFDETAAWHVIHFFGYLRHSKGEWAKQPIKLEPWQQFWLWVLFGWKKRADGKRRFNTSYGEIARKNGKSTLASGIALYLLVADGEEGAEVYAGATKRDQARIVFSEAVRMVRESPHLSRRLTIVKDNLSFLAANSKFEPLGSEEEGNDGLNVHAAIVDELHAHKTRALFDVLDTATGARSQPLIFIITTAGPTAPAFAGSSGTTPPRSWKARSRTTRSSR